MATSSGTRLAHLSIAVATLVAAHPSIVRSSGTALFRRGTSPAGQRKNPRNESWRVIVLRETLAGKLVCVPRRTKRHQLPSTFRAVEPAIRGKREPIGAVVNVDDRQQPFAAGRVEEGATAVVKAAKQQAPLGLNAAADRNPTGLPSSRSFRPVAASQRVGVLPRKYVNTRLPLAPMASLQSRSSGPLSRQTVLPVVASQTTTSPFPNPSATRLPDASRATDSHGRRPPSNSESSLPECVSHTALSWTNRLPSRLSTTRVSVRLPRFIPKSGSPVCVFQWVAPRGEPLTIR